MGKKKNHNHGSDNHDHADDGENEVVKKENGGGGDDNNNKKKEAKNPSCVVLKIEMHCEGCASKIIKFARGFEGVEGVKAESEANKLTVNGKVDPCQIRDFLHQKTKKKVELISPQPKKEDSNGNKNDAKKQIDNKKSDADDRKKPKEPPVTTAVIKVAFHCQGCIEKIKKTVIKTKGVHDMTFDKQKETVAVKGTMDVEALTDALKERLKRPVEIVPPKKEKDGGKDGGDNAGVGGGKKKKGGGGGGEGQDNPAAGGGGDVAAPKLEGNRMEYMVQPGYGFGPQPGYGYMGHPMPAYGSGYMGQPVAMYGNGYMGMAMAPPVPVSEYGYGYGGYGQVPGYPVHMKFNDENPNACSIM